MATKQRIDTMKDWDARDIIRKGEITSELEFERAVWTERSLDLLSQEQPELEVLRKEIFNMIVQYESFHWSNFESIPKDQFKESDLAEGQAKKEFNFLKKRKTLILQKLEKYALSQNDLAAILSHNKSYISELLKGTRAFSMNDLIIIHRLFNIKLEDLFFTEIPLEKQAKIKKALYKKASNTSQSKKSSQVSSLVKALYS